jgi:hypothetical protein
MAAPNYNTATRAGATLNVHDAAHRLMAVMGTGPGGGGPYRETLAFQKAWNQSGFPGSLGVPQHDGWPKLREDGSYGQRTTHALLTMQTFWLEQGDPTKQPHSYTPPSPGVREPVAFEFAAPPASTTAGVPWWLPWGALAGVAGAAIYGALHRPHPPAQASSPPALPRTTAGAGVETDPHRDEAMCLQLLIQQLTAGLERARRMWGSGPLADHARFWFGQLGQGAVQNIGPALDALTSGESSSSSHEAWLLNGKLASAVDFDAAADLVRQMQGLYAAALAGSTIARNLGLTVPTVTTSGIGVHIDLGKALQGVVHGVGDVANQAGSDVTHPGRTLGDVAHGLEEAATHPERDVKVVVRDVGDVAKAVRPIADAYLSIAQGVVSLLPGIGTGVSSAIGAAQAVLDGGGLLAVAIRTAYGAIPIPAGLRFVTDPIVDAVIALAEHQNIEEAALYVMRDRIPSGIPRDVFDTLVRVIEKKKPIVKQPDAVRAHMISSFVDGPEQATATGIRNHVPPEVAAHLRRLPPAHARFPSVSRPTPPSVPSVVTLHAATTTPEAPRPSGRPRPPPPPPRTAAPAAPPDQDGAPQRPPPPVAQA